MGCYNSNEPRPMIKSDRTSKKVNYKVVLLGKYNAGKTSIISRYQDQVWPDNHQPTLGANYSSMLVTTEGPNAVNLEVWDTSGQEKYAMLLPVYYKDATVSLIVFDITDISSYKIWSTWMKKINKNSIIFLIGNKVDLDERQVERKQAKSFAKSYGAKYRETSAKTGYGINELFSLVGNLIQ